MCRMMKLRSHIYVLSLVVPLMPCGPLQAGTPSALKVAEAQRRMDPTGAGAYHRVGLFREQSNTRKHLQRRQNERSLVKNKHVPKS